MRFRASSRSPWRVLLEMALLLVVALAPTAQFVCDALPGEQHPGGDVHAGPALVVHAPALPVMALSGLPFPLSGPESGPGVRPSIFVPPRA